MSSENHTSPRLSASLDNPSTDAIDGSERYLLLEVEAPVLPHEQAVRLPNNLAVVIDASGSMSGTPLNAAKTAVHSLIEALDDGDLLSIVSFADEARVHSGPETINEIGRRRLHKATRGVGTHGCTNLFEGWRHGVLQAAEVMKRDGQRRSRVLLLSDGHANRGLLDPVAIATHADELRQRGLFTSTVGIGLGYSPTFLLALAEAGGGSQHHTDTGEDMVDVLLGELDDTRRTVAENAEIEVELPDGVEATVLGASDLRSVGGTLRLRLGSLVERAHLFSAVRLRTPPSVVGDLFTVRARLAWSPPGLASHRLQGDVVTVTLHARGDSLAMVFERDVEVAGCVADLWNAWAIRRATSLNESGDYRQAASFLDEELKRFQAYVQDLPEGLPLLRELQSLRCLAGRPLDPAMHKGFVTGAAHALHGSVDKRRSMRGRDYKQGLREVEH